MVAFISVFGEGFLLDYSIGHMADMFEHPLGQKPVVVGHPLAVETWGDVHPSFPKLRETIEVVDPGLTVVDRKLFDVLLAHSYDALALNPNRTFAAASADLKRAIGWTSHGGSAEISESLLRLQQTVILIGYFSESGDLRQRRMNLLITSDVPQQEGIVYWRFHPELALFLANPREYAFINLTVTAKFVSGYSHRLYQLLDLRIQRNEMEWVVDVMEIRKLLCATEKSYDDFGALQRKVLQVAVRDVNDYASFQVEFDRITVPKSRKVSHVKFTLTWADQPLGGIIPGVSGLPSLSLGPVVREQGVLDFQPVPPDEKSIQAMMRRVLRKRAHLVSRYCNWPLDDLVRQWASDLLSRGMIVTRPSDAFENWLKIFYGQYFRDGEPLAAVGFRIETWATSDTLKTLGLAMLGQKGSRRIPWVAAARRKNPNLGGVSTDVIDVHRWLPLVVDDVSLAMRYDIARLSIAGTPQGKETVVP